MMKRVITCRNIFNNFRISNRSVVLATSSSLSTAQRCSNKTFFTSSLARYQDINNNGNQGLVFDQPKSSNTSQPNSSDSTSYHSPPLIFELDMSNFEQVVTKSKQPVVLVCYADWNSPSKQMVAALEQYAIQNAGSLIVGKLNTEKFPDIAQSLQVQALPSVFALYAGKVVDHLQTMPSKDKLDQFIDDLLLKDESNSSRKLINKAEQLYNSAQYKQAIEIYQTLLQSPGCELIGLRGLISCSIKENNIEALKGLIDYTANSDKYKLEIHTPLLQQAQRLVELSKELNNQDGESIDTLLEKLNSNPKDLDTKYKLSLLYYQNGQSEQAMQQLLDSIKIDKHYNEDQAKNLLFKIFDSMPTDPLVSKYRSRFSNIWFL